jgi:hypothetical protein
MAKQGFRRNAKTIAMILRTVDGGKRAAADKILAALPADADARIDVYQTDREVIGVVVPGYKQAKDGIATRAASAAGMSQGRP